MFKIFINFINNILIKTKVFNILEYFDCDSINKIKTGIFQLHEIEFI